MGITSFNWIQPKASPIGDILANTYKKTFNCQSKPKDKSTQCGTLVGPFLYNVLKVFYLLCIMKLCSIAQRYRTSPAAAQVPLTTWLQVPTPLGSSTLHYSPYHQKKLFYHGPDVSRAMVIMGNPIFNFFFVAQNAPRKKYTT